MYDAPGRDQVLNTKTVEICKTSHIFLAPEKINIPEFLFLARVCTQTEANLFIVRLGLGL